LSNVQLYMWEGTRRVILARHRFYVAEVRKRLISQFDDIEGEADRYEEEAWERALQAPSWGNDDLSDAAEWARDEAIGHYMMLNDLRKQVLLSSIAGLFHQWDKELREFIDMELRHNIKREWIDKNVWKATTFQIFELIEEFDWKPTSLPFFPFIDACNLVVNVYKHGKGPALDRLHKTFPQYLSRMARESMFGKSFIDHRWVEVTTAHFDEFAQAFDDFWTQMPERCYLVAGSNP
jgi:hypothetical protein